MKRSFLSVVLGVHLFSFSFMPACFAPASGQNSVSDAKHVLKITEGIRSPLRIAFDHQDNAFVVDAVGGKIIRYDRNGTFLGEILSDGSLLGIAATSQDLLYAGERLSGEIRLLDNNGQLLKTIAVGVELPLSAALDDENRLYFVDAKNHAVKVIDTGTNNIVGTFGKGILGFPTGIAFDSKNQRILVAEHGGLSFSDSIAAPGMIHLFNKRGDLLTNIGIYGHETGEFTRIQGLAVDFDGRIYAADPFQGVVTVLDEDGTFLTTIGEFGKELGQLRAPMDVAIDSRNRLWVASMNNGSLEVFDIGDFPTDVAAIEAPAMPTHSKLWQNYPNPFNPGTWIPFVLEKESDVVIHIYNEIGKRVRTFRLGRRQRGHFTTDGKAVYWDGTNSRGAPVASGIYIYKIHAGEFTAARRMLLLK